MMPGIRGGLFIRDYYSALPRLKRQPATVIADRFPVLWVASAVPALWFWLFTKPDFTQIISTAALEDPAFDTRQ